MSTSQMMDIYLLNFGMENAHYGEMSTYPNISQPTVNELMPIWEKLNTNKQLYIYNIHIYIYVYI